MEFEVVRGRFKAWGDGVIRTGNGNISKTIYSWVEMHDGRIIKKFALLTGVGGRVEAAMKSQEEVEFHIVELPGDQGPENTIVAVKGADGRLFAIDTNLPAGTGFFLVMGPFVFGLVGILFTLTFIGAVLGIPVLIFAFRIRAKSKQLSRLREYVAGLPGAITV